MRGGRGGGGSSHLGREVHRIEGLKKVRQDVLIHNNWKHIRINLFKKRNFTSFNLPISNPDKKVRLHWTSISMPLLIEQLVCCSIKVLDTHLELQQPRTILQRSLQRRYSCPYPSSLLGWSGTYHCVKRSDLRYFLGPQGDQKLPSLAEQAIFVSEAVERWPILTFPIPS